jgi:hypothetical protein
VEISGRSSATMDLDPCIVLGSILGPLLSAIFVSPLFDLANLTSFADDNFIVGLNVLLQVLICEKKSQNNHQMVRDSGLQVNEGKTKVSLLHQNYQPLTSINLLGKSIETKQNFLISLAFNSKLSWGPQVAHSITKANKSLYAIKLIKKCFKQNRSKSYEQPIFTLHCFTVFKFRDQLFTNCVNKAVDGLYLWYIILEITT